ncbi:MAG: hydrogenase expression/formation C-terminal domain-containing protein [Sedimenticola sp.]
MTEYYIPSIGSGPGSQPTETDGAELDILQLPSEMSTFAMPDLPEAEEAAGLVDGISALDKLQEALGRFGRVSPEIDISDLDEENRALIDQVLGEGEVSAVYSNSYQARVQESVLAGVWRVKYLDEMGALVRDTIEVGPMPDLVGRHTFRQAAHHIGADDVQIPEGVLNAPPLISEINDKVAGYRPGMPPHVINLTLLPQTEQDLAFLSELLGQGPVTILSRGYGNCRITSTATEHVWWVQYFNSQDANILNTIEIGGVPEVACAASEDIRDSAERLSEIMEVYR